MGMRHCITGCDYSCVQVFPRAEQPATSHHAGGSGQRGPSVDCGYDRECGTGPSQRQTLPHRASCTVEHEPQRAASIGYDRLPNMLLLINLFCGSLLFYH